jgi:hypothetical protein
LVKDENPIELPLPREIEGGRRWAESVLKSLSWVPDLDSWSWEVPTSGILTLHVHGRLEADRVSEDFGGDLLYQCGIDGVARSEVLRRLVRMVLRLKTS